MFFLIEQTNACNLKCVCCPNRFHERPLGFMSPEMFREIIEQIVKYDSGARNIRVALHGFGEPILSPHLFKNLQTLEDYKFVNVDFSSNGVLFTPEIASKLVRFNCISWVRISLNSGRREAMERINTGSNYNTVVFNIHKFLDIVKENNYPFKVVIQLMQTKLNESECPEDYYKLFGRRDFEVWLKRLDTLGSQIDYKEVEDLAFPGEMQTGCIFANNSIFIHWNGNIVACCLDNTDSQVYGNISEGIFSVKTTQHRDTLREKFLAKDFTDLPVCKRCVEGYRG